MKSYYSSLESIPLNLLGKNHQLSNISLNQNKKIFDTIEKEIFENFVNNKSDKALQEKSLPILKEIIFEFYKIIQSLVEIESCKRNNTKIFFDKINSPIFSSLLNNIRPKRNNYENSYSPSIKKKIKLFLKKIESLIHIRKTYDLHNQSLLLNEFIRAKNIKYSYLWPEIFIIPFTNNKLITEFSDEKISSILKSLFLKFDISSKYTSRAFFLLSSYISKHFQIVNNLFYSFSNTNFLEAMSDKLIGGTPQILGRVLNSVYISSQKKVLRFAHGGERVFFSDKLWVITELLNSTEYYTHGTPEKISVEKKISNLPIKLKKLMPSKITTLGSKKHQIIYENSKGLNSKIKKKVIFFPGCFLGERFLHNPFFKPSDIFLADYIKAFISEISKIGYEVIIKTHPGGIQQERFFNSLGTTVLKSIFNLRDYNNSILAFDFAGTAFTDSLSSNFPILLLNNGARPFSNLYLLDLKKRCEILDPYYSNNNIRFKNKDIKLSLKRAVEKSENFESFSSKFFF